jgi:predicted RND superfamily exporter protein
MKKKNYNTMFNKLVNNKITLYIVAIIAFIVLVGHIINSQFSAILLFFLAGGVAYCFTKNMTIVLGSSLAVTTIATMSRSFFVYQEGMKEGIDLSNNPDKKKSESEEPGESEEPEESEKPGTQATGAMGKGSTRTLATGKSSGGTGTSPPEGLTQLKPALLDNIPNKDQMQKQLGKATEMEQAYDNLEKIMGKDNIQSISTDTKDLIKQQNELIKQLKTMTPALNDAMSSIGNLDFSKLSGMFNSATQALSQLKSQ